MTHPKGRILVVGAPGSADWSAGQGAIWYFTLDNTGAGLAERISGNRGGFGGFLQVDEGFGGAVASAGDLNGDLVTDLLVGAPGNDQVNPDAGVVWLLELATQFQPRSELFGTQNPATLTVASGEPRLGQNVTLEMHYPAGVGGPGGLTLLYLATYPDATAPVGTLVPNYVGAVLIDVSTSTSVSGPAWSGAPVQLSSTISPSLTPGTSLYLQGAVIGPFGVMLTNGLRLIIAD